MAKLAKGEKLDEILEKQRQELEFKELVREARKFFAKNSATIEIARNRHLERVHFILLPFCHYLPKETRT